ncbi:hypothetical protein [Sphingobium sp.]|uniref:hypothetical protein n=1 Tax=Sphingobium sp. TaxID=1912891 RepID=UPI002C354C77|nr:hypothetical protein [Sphingobium sp.]HUD92117.1 hypothetical protein [Sphingobium sp.]
MYPCKPGSSLSKPLSITLGFAATLLIMVAPQAASRPLGCDMPRRMATECLGPERQVQASNYCKPYLA